MYCSLSSIDIVAMKADGREEYTQVDHREAGEIERDRELSTIFALIRMLNPKRAAKPGEPEPSVVYCSIHQPPEFLREAVRAAGGAHVLGLDREPVSYEGGARPLEEIAGEAFAALARRTAAEHSVELTSDGLERIERELAAAAGSREEDEVGYWSAVIKLGAVAGEAIRVANGGRWIVVESGSLPFSFETTFRGEEAKVNTLGKAIKLLANGDDDSIAALVGVVAGEP